MIRRVLKANALRWANRRRRGPALDELLTGRPKVPGECPLANTLGANARVDVFGWQPEPSNRWRRLPMLVRVFVTVFDYGGYPELVAPSPAELRALERAPTREAVPA